MIPFFHERFHPRACTLFSALTATYPPCPSYLNYAVVLATVGYFVSQWFTGKSTSEDVEKKVANTAKAAKAAKPSPAAELGTKAVMLRTRGYIPVPTPICVVSRWFPL